MNFAENQHLEAVKRHSMLIYEVKWSNYKTNTQCNCITSLCLARYQCMFTFLTKQYITKYFADH